MVKTSIYIRYGISAVALYLLSFSFSGSGISAQVGARVEFLRQSDDSSSVIQIRWDKKDQHKWHEENDGRLDIMALKTNVHSEILTKNQDRSTYYHFDIPGSSSIELLIHLIETVPGEKLYLWDHQQQEVVFILSEQHGSKFLTPAFNPATTVLVWNGSETSTYKTRFTIDNIYYDETRADRSLDIGFGTALPCHPNAACKQDSLMQLIANSAVRIRLVMEEGIGWCSGAFINNARNDKTPLLITAYHCQFNFTPHYDMWRFDFNYRSDTCPNPPIEPQIFSLTGCELISSGQASDFLLVLLAEEIPLNQSMTFAGWNRDEASIPDTTFLLHHPNADIRKISTSTDEAVIHPNQIGWSEGGGYTTPPHHHFRLKFTEGGHEPGSSGGPVFDEEGLFVGQLHGGTAGCESINNAFIGRFAKSWNLGPTPEERLRDWLDPDQTGVVSLGSLENINPDELADIHGVVVDGIGRPVKNVEIKISGSIEETLITSDDGEFLLSGVSRNGDYTITPEKNINPTNGLNAIDLIAIQKHLLGKDTFDFNWQHIAADATNNVNVSVTDILMLLRLMLGKIIALPFSPSWRFDPPQVVLDSIPPGDPMEIQITGIKIGDINSTADPAQ